MFAGPRRSGSRSCAPDATSLSAGSTDPPECPLGHPFALPRPMRLLGPWSPNSRAEEATMTQIPEGAQRSEDGSYWWDGSAWQLVDPAPGAGAAPAEQEGQEGQAQETEPRQKQVAAAGQPGGEAQAPSIA